MSSTMLERRLSVRATVTAELAHQARHEPLAPLIPPASDPPSNW